MVVKRKRFSRLFGIAGVSLACIACAGEASTDVATFSAEQCSRVSILDRDTGASVSGIEDFALDVAGGRLFLSAYNRRDVENAVRKHDFDIPQGGVYRLSVAALMNAEESVSATPIVHPDDVAGGLRPHGIDYDPVSGDVAFINRAYQRINGKWRRTTNIEKAGADGETFVGARTEAPCAANDLIADANNTLISFDHEACGWRAGMEDALRLRRSGLAAQDGYPLYDGAAYANGVVRSAKGELVLAATRESSLIVMTRTSQGYAEDRRIEVPGGPDNLTASPDGGIVAAVHPSLWRIGLQRKFGVATAPSRIVKIDLDSGVTRTLFDDPSGKIFSAATVAAEYHGGLIAGSVTDAGLLVCRPDA